MGATSSNGVPLPEHCQVQGIINKRTGTDGFPYGDGFEVRLAQGTGGKRDITLARFAPAFTPRRAPAR